MTWLPLFPASRAAQLPYVELFDLAIAGEVLATMAGGDYYVDAHSLYGWLVDHDRLPPALPPARARAPFVQRRATAPRPDTIAELDRVLGVTARR